MRVVVVKHGGSVVPVAVHCVEVVLFFWTSGGGVVPRAS